MSMFISEDGTAYAEGHYEVKDNHIINQYTGKSLGRLVRTIPSTNYIHVGGKKKDHWLKELIFWWRTGEHTPYVRQHNVPDDAVGTLSETMAALAKDVEKSIYKAKGEKDEKDK